MHDTPRRCYFVDIRQVASLCCHLASTAKASLHRDPDIREMDQREAEKRETEIQ